MSLRTDSTSPRPTPRTRREPPDRNPVAVVGAGPYGLATAAHLSGAGTPRRVFGEPMAGWKEHMPRGMRLKSLPIASSISAPGRGFGIADFRAERGLPSVGDRYAIPLEEFVDYGEWFQHRLVPDVERTAVRRIEAVDGGFGLTLETGEQWVAGSVVMATGLEPFTHEPPELASAREAGLASHTCAHNDLSTFRGRRVTVLGGGQSALESAALLHEAGARPTVVSRAPAVVFGDPPVNDSLRQRRWYIRALKPDSPLGPGWSLLACCRAAAAYRSLPFSLRRRLLHRVLGPSGAWWLRDRVQGTVPVLCGRRVLLALPDQGSVRLTLLAPDGGREVVATDHVLVATGYRVDVDRLRILEPTLRQAVRTGEGAPQLSPGFESSVPGLYFTGLAAAPTFGPVLRFVHGTRFAAPRIADAVTTTGRGP